MKRQADQENQTIFAVYAEDKKGLIGQVLALFNRSDHPIISMSVSRTDISELVLITLEAEVPVMVQSTFAEKLKKIIEVYNVTIYPAQEGLKKIGFYRMSLAALDRNLWNVIAKYGAQLSSISEKCLVISKTGMDKDLTELYRILEGPHLLGFCKNGLIMEESLVLLDQL